MVGPGGRGVVDDEDELRHAEEALQCLRRPIKRRIPREDLPRLEDRVRGVEVVQRLLHILARAHRVQMNGKQRRHLVQEGVHSRPQHHLELHVLHPQRHLPLRRARRAFRGARRRRARPVLVRASEGARRQLADVPPLLPPAARLPHPRRFLAFLLLLARQVLLLLALLTLPALLRVAAPLERPLPRRRAARLATLLLHLPHRGAERVD
mmetsp:Transcript_22331/g.55547  ORF Transcript_22331/g.55547 Transcript_22331/m.55547 type:complete len:209 (+) Transcript_22331:216-842(+)